MVISCAVPLSNAAQKSQPTAWQALVAYTELEAAAVVLMVCAATPGT